ncbi:uncharacterized protein LOC128996544 [Macrosteles quadrilineatus]|uniref:uncharacterized protein LOC128996544 n=1 Tax=Macrosteles quadrilineatus TaxID=74068 RepID=UPI0023E13091|nr:uncharacterized protein LOC128996544 [Macrosteles quadrilineatus]
MKEDSEVNRIEKVWKNIKETLQDCAKEVCGKRERKNKKPWFDEECKANVLQRKKAKEVWLNKKQERDRENYTKISRETVKVLRRKKREWVNQILEKAEQDRTANNSRDFYRSIRFFRKGYSPMPYGIKNKSGQLVVQNKEGLQVWQEHFKDLLNVRQSEQEEEEEEVYQNVDPIVPYPTIQEVKTSIKELKNNKAPGEDSIPSEVIKAGGSKCKVKVNGEFSEDFDINTGVRQGDENWVISKRTEKRLIVFENKILRKIFGPTFENGEWRVKHNRELRELYRDPDIVAEVRSRRLRWAGHVLRKEEGSLVRNALNNNPEGRRPPGRPKLRWRDQVRRDLRRMGRREDEAMDRAVWRQCVGEAKYLLGYQEPRQ